MRSRVARYGARRNPRSKALTACALMRARSARACCESPACVRNFRRSAGSPPFPTASRAPRGGNDALRVLTTGRRRDSDRGIGRSSELSAKGMQPALGG